MYTSPLPLSARFADVFDLGQGHSFIWLWRRPFDWPESQPWTVENRRFPDDVYGVMEQHPFTGDTATLCEEIVYLRHPYDHSTDHVWRVNSWLPLDIDPSVLCSRCGAHGYLRSGKWVDVV